MAMVKNSNHSTGHGSSAPTTTQLNRPDTLGPALAFAARMNGRLVGSVQQTPVAAGAAGTLALLRGALAVQPELRGQGIGRALLRRSLDAARAAGTAHVFLIGERAYYAPLAFGPAEAVGVSVAGEPGDRVHHMALHPDLPAPQGELRPRRRLCVGRHTGALR